MTTVRELKQIIEDLPDDMEIIATGMNGYGLNLEAPEIIKMVYDDNTYSEETQPQEVLSFDIDSYLFESEDVGNCEMWINEEEFKELLINNTTENC